MSAIQSARAALSVIAAQAATVIAEIDAELAPVDTPPTTDPTPPAPPVDPAPVPAPDPVPVPPIIGYTVASNAADLMTKVQALRGQTGDRKIGIKDGHHDALTLSGINLGGGTLTVIAENRRRAKFDRILITGGSQRVRLQGVGSCPKGEATVAGLSNKLYGIEADTSTAFITVADAICQGHVESANHANWTLAEWRARGMGGVFLQGPDSAALDSYAAGVRFGFNSAGPRGVLSNLRVFGASGDAFRCVGDDSRASLLLGTDLVYINDGNHPDGFQAFGNGGKGVLLKNLTVDRVALIEWTVRPDNPLRWNAGLSRWGIMQGIGFHATTYENLNLSDIYVKTAVQNGIHIGASKGLYGRNWRVLNGDYGQPSFDTRFPKIAIDGASGVVDVADTWAEEYTASSKAIIRNMKVSDYTAAEPAWIAPLRALAA